MEFSSKQPLGLFRLVMINVIAVDSIRTLAFSAVYGFSLVFFYILMGLLFFLPTALVSAELGTGWPNRGGIYVWVREAFGKRWSLAVIWLNWIYNVIWYPTIMALIAGIFAYLIDPALADDKPYMCAAVLILFWAATIANCFGMNISSAISAIGAIAGTIFPMLFIAILGIVWIVKGNPTEIQFTWDQFFPHESQADNLAFLTNVLFGLLGLEMAATHAAEMRSPTRDYPRSLWISSVIILGTIVFASLAVAAVVPRSDLSLATGIMQAFAIFFKAFHLEWLLPAIALCIILGSLSGVGAWIIGPTKGLLVASRDGSLPKFFAKENRYGVPSRILVVQAVLVSILSFAFVLFPTVNSSYWILSVVTAQLALLVYLALFAAAIKLRYQKPDVARAFRIPGKKKGVWLVAGAGAVTAFAVILFGFLPPAQVPFQSVLLYETILVVCMLLFTLAPFLMKKKN